LPKRPAEQRVGDLQSCWLN